MTDSPLRLVAVDLGAESGRAVVGTFDGDRLALEDVHRFPNVPVTLAGTLHWDFLRLFGDVTAGLRRAAAGRVRGVRRRRHRGAWTSASSMPAAGSWPTRSTTGIGARRGCLDLAFAVVPRDEIYAATGIQMMPINTLYQLWSMVRAGDPLLGQADRLLMMADLFHHFLAGSTVAEYTNASTSQCLDPIARDWARPLLERFGIPTAILPPVVAPGTILGSLREEIADETGLRDTRVVAPGSHDTASAVVGAPLAGPTTAFLSSGTWSLIGLEVAAPVITAVSLAANLTNEGGVGGTIRLLRNVVGLWLVQESRRALWPAGDGPSYAELAELAEAAPASPRSSIPTTSASCAPATCPPACVRSAPRRASRSPPTRDADPGPPREPRAPLCRARSTSWREPPAIPSRRSRSVGGGSNNRLLCRLTASATGLPVRAGPVEATASGNICVQAIAAGELASVAEARELIARSFPVRSTYEPEGDWAEARARFADVTTRGLPAPRHRRSLTKESPMPTIAAVARPATASAARARRVGHVGHQHRDPVVGLREHGDSLPGLPAGGRAADGLREDRRRGDRQPVHRHRGFRLSPHPLGPGGRLRGARGLRRRARPADRRDQQQHVPGRGLQARLDLQPGPPGPGQGRRRDRRVLRDRGGHERPGRQGLAGRRHQLPGPGRPALAASPPRRGPPGSVRPPAGRRPPVPRVQALRARPLLHGRPGLGPVARGLPPARRSGWASAWTPATTPWA